MKKLAVLTLVLCFTISSTAAFSRGGGTGSHSGMGSHHSPATGGAFGERVSAPGTNSLGTALSTTGIGNGSAPKGPLLSTSAAVDHEEAKVDRMMTSICRGC
jgi:hypothetical protein